MRGLEEAAVSCKVHGQSFRVGPTERWLQRLILLQTVALGWQSSVLFLVERSTPCNQGWAYIFLYTSLPEPRLPGLALFSLSTYDLSDTHNYL